MARDSWCCGTSLGALHNSTIDPIGVHLIGRVHGSSGGLTAISEKEFMLKTLERNIASVNERVVLLAPSVASVGEVFRNVDVDRGRHEQLVRDVQKLRGSIYLKDGAIRSEQLSSDGLHQTPEDEKGWHMLLLNEQHQVSACALYLEHDNTVSFEGLRVRQCPLAENEEWRPRLWKAVHAELAHARRDRLQFVELGGWAVSENSRGTSGPLALALAVYAFSRRCGGALGMTTAVSLVYLGFTYFSAWKILALFLPSVLSLTLATAVVAGLWKRPKTLEKLCLGTILLNLICVVLMMAVVWL